MKLVAKGFLHLYLCGFFVEPRFSKCKNINVQCLHNSIQSISLCIILHVYIPSPYHYILIGSYQFKGLFSEIEVVFVFVLTCFSVSFILIICFHIL